MSAHKARRVIDQIRGHSYEETLTILELMPYRACYSIFKLVYSAAANASHNMGFNETDSIISKTEAYMALNDIDAAVESFKKASELEPNDGGIKKEYSAAGKKIADRRDQERKAYSRMSAVCNGSITDLSAMLPLYIKRADSRDPPNGAADIFAVEFFVWLELESDLAFHLFLEMAKYIPGTILVLSSFYNKSQRLAWFISGIEIKMGFSCAQGLILLVTASMFAVSLAKTTIVGGSTGWQYGFNYTDWALRNSPFFLNDTLVFKYDSPNSTTFLHNVYLLPNLWSFGKCDFRRAKLLADVEQGGGTGFEFVLKKVQPQYFACGESNGDHCKAGRMKFFVMPLPRCRGCHG
ncbi:hypothetical protein HHK36_030889 [Tetracentron sinense]|uniref:Phytocyanin domain-containing protein n=1 Tax=Tetracentron sinense TaxID=13715 RepID=A0A834YCH8_TETSI|nr:hypothetical protein HHK36_030889 [Tetracentron sinense]